MSTPTTEAPAADLISVPVPRAVAWIVSKIGWPGLGLGLLLAQATGWIDVAFLALGLPPLMGDRSSEPAEDAEDAPDECGELLAVQQAETIYQRTMAAETLSILARIERGCGRD